MPVKGAVTSLGEMCEFNPYIPGQRERNSPKDSLETFFFFAVLGLAARAFSGYSKQGLRCSCGAQAQDEQAR